MYKFLTSRAPERFFQKSTKVYAFSIFTNSLLKKKSLKPVTDTEEKIAIISFWRP